MLTHIEGELCTCFLIRMARWKEDNEEIILHSELAKHSCHQHTEIILRKIGPKLLNKHWHQHQYANNIDTSVIVLTFSPLEYGQWSWEAKQEISILVHATFAAYGHISKISPTSIFAVSVHDLPITMIHKVVKDIYIWIWYVPVISVRSFQGLLLTPQRAGLSFEKFDHLLAHQNRYYIVLICNILGWVAVSH